MHTPVEVEFVAHRRGAVREGLSISRGELQCRALGEIR